MEPLDGADQTETDDRLPARLVAAHESERARIAASLHDECIQSLAAVDLRLGLLSVKLPPEAADLAPLVRLVQDDVTEASRVLRQLLLELEPPDPAATLEDVLENAAGQAFVDRPVSWTVISDSPAGPRESEQTRTLLLRIAQGALRLVAQDPAVQRVQLEVRYDGTGIELRLSDDRAASGRGVEVLDAQSEGLGVLLDRAAAAGGWCRTASTVDGTATTAWLPYD